MKILKLKTFEKRTFSLIEILLVFIKKNVEAMDKLQQL